MFANQLRFVIGLYDHQLLLGHMEELKASNLGTKCYWNDAYKKELDNYHDHNDPGDEWFGRKATKRVVGFIINYFR